MASILVVDDDPDILGLLRLVFESAGHEVTTTSNPQQARELAQSLDVGAVVLDVMMPGLSGWDVLGQLRAEPATSQVPILMLSAIGDSGNRTRGLREGADDFLSKPFAPDELLARAERLIARHSSQPINLQGRLAPGILAEILQGLAQTRRSGRLEVNGSRRQGNVYVRQGAIVGAQIGALTGFEAAVEALDVRNGQFRLFEDKSVPATAQCEPIQIHPLLMDAAWFEDEMAARREHLPSDEANVRWLGEVAWPEAFEGLPFQRFATFLRRVGSTSVGELRGKHLAARSRADLCLALLIELGAVSVSDGVPASEAAALPVAGDDELDTGLRDLFQAMVYRGFPIDRLDLVVVAHDTAFQTFEAWRREAVERDWLCLPCAESSGQSPAFCVRHEGRRLTLTYCPWPTSAKAPAEVEPAAIVLLWPHADLKLVDANLCGRAIEGNVPDGAVLMGPKRPGFSDRWSGLAALPSSLAELLSVTLASCLADEPSTPVA